MNKDELAAYHIKYSGGILRFLDGIELKVRENDENKEV